jgi:hypothetical protein
MADLDGLPLIRSLSIGGVLIDSPERPAALAKRPGELGSGEVEEIRRHLAVSFPSAA